MESVNVEILCHAIIARACVDYQRALCGEGISDNAGIIVRTPEAVLAEVEQFFKSDWFEMMSKVSGEFLMRKLREEAAAANFKWKLIRKCPEVDFSLYK